jgi:hypothetical protein
MRQIHLTFIALGTVALLAACGNQSQPASATQADVAEKRAELEKLEADLAAQEQESAAAPAAPSASTASTSRPAASSRPASTAKPAPKPAAPPAPPVAQSITVPAGTEVTVALVSALSSKSAKVGQAVHARVTSNVMVDGRTAIPQGLNVAGSVVKVVSGSDRIGGTPALVLAFDRIELPNGDDVQIAGEFEEKGKSDNTRDTVKIVGGAAAGTLLADQVSKKDRNRVIGGIIGAAAGAVAAKETGTEVKLDEGATFTLILSAPVEMPRT